MRFLTSWDDGYALDLRIAKLLEERNLPGTFYVCPKPQHNRGMLTEKEIQELSKKFEIGAHTLTHPKLTQISLEEARHEIEGSKKWIEDVTGKPCAMFCYPKGDESEAIRKLVKDAGFQGARTVEAWKFSTDDPFRQPVSLQIMPFPFRKSFKPLWKILDPLGPLRANWKHLVEFHLPLSASFSWLNLATSLFEYAKRTHQPFFHLYGHSHEVEKYGMWGELEAFLDHVVDSIHV